ncbi:hypothetical protein Tco_1444496, partial [Tanacetum coccineum]
VPNALDDDLVAPANRLQIGKCNLRLSPTLKSKEPTIQVVLDALKLTSFYKAFEITADVPEIYMQEFWVTASRHHSSLRFKMNGKSHTVNVENFSDMLKIFPKLLGQKFKDPPLEEEILSFIRDLGHTGEIKFLSDVNVNHMHRPWRSFAAIINKCLSGKTTALENLVYQVENKKSKKNNDMYYLRFTKVIVDYFMAKDQGIPRRNKMFWHYARDDFMFTIIRVISKHHDTQVYGVILPQHLINQAMVESEAYKTYLAYATGEKFPKLKHVKNKADSESSPKKKTAITSKGSKVKSSSKKTKSDKKKQPVIEPKSKGLTVLSEAALSEADQINTNEGAGDKPEILDVPEYILESEEEPWTFSQGEDDAENDEHDSEDDNDEHDSENNKDDEDDDQENVSGETESDDDKDDLVHPNLSTYKADDQEEEKGKEKANDDDEVSSNQKVTTPPDYELTEEEENREDDDVMGGEQKDEED